MKNRILRYPAIQNTYNLSAFQNGVSELTQCKHFWDIYAQAVNLEGDVLWQTDGIPVCVNGTDQSTQLWEDTGLALCTAAGIQKHASVVSDGEGGFVVVWRDERDVYSDLYMQRIRADGTLVWEKDGIPLCTAGGHQDKPFIVRTAENRFSVVWLDYREDFGEESRDAIYHQQIDLEGKPLWDRNGIAISTSEGKHYPPFVVTVGAGKWYVVWSNTEKDNGDIYLEQF